MSTEKYSNKLAIVCAMLLPGNYITQIKRDFNNSQKYNDKMRF